MLSWETLIGLARSSGDSVSAASSTLREAQPEYRMCVRASSAVSVFTLYRMPDANPSHTGKNAVPTRVPTPASRHAKIAKLARAAAVAHILDLEQDAVG